MIPSIWLGIAGVDLNVDKKFWIFLFVQGKYVRIELKEAYKWIQGVQINKKRLTPLARTRLNLVIEKLNLN